jgi:hypothetical protein
MSRGHRTRQLVTGASVALFLSLASAGVAHAGGTTADPAAGAGGAAPCTLPTPFRGQDFSAGLRIDNRFLPMRPGTVLKYRGQVVEGGQPVTHEVIFTVTDLYKQVDGVRSRVIFDVDLNDGALAEAELAFFAQDDAGNVWNLGEYPEEYDNGTFTGAPSTWIAGQARASAGIHMLAHPAIPANRQKEYLQGRAPTIDFLDCAEVQSVGGRARVPAGTFTDVLTTFERSPLESRTAIQTKEHAPGVGIVRIGSRNDPEGETLELVQAVALTPAQLGRVDDQARVLDRRAYRVSTVYRATSPAQVSAW